MNKKLGYYTVGNKQFEKKIEALICATKVYYLLDKTQEAKSLVRWYFNDEIFEQYNWTVEPEQSLKTLYHQRAKQLRGQYDYIIVSYSGGADSHNIVMSFLDQGLHIDELYVVTKDRGNNQITNEDISSSMSYSSDIYFQTIPRLKDILIKAPNTKIQYLEMTDLVFKTFSAYKDASWVLNMREELNPVDVTRFAFSNNISTKKILDKGLKIGVVLGIDKPRIRIDALTGAVYIVFADRQTNGLPIKEHIEEYSNATVEFFYWSPDACDLLCKQAHVLKKWLELCPDMRPFYTINSGFKSLKGDTTLGQLNNTNIPFSERFVVPIIYDNWDNSWFQANKSERDWFPDTDYWFIKGAKDTREHNIWLEGVKYIATHAFPYIRSPEGFPDRFVRWHKNYYIGNLHN